MDEFLVRPLDGPCHYTTVWVAALSPPQKLGISGQMTTFNCEQLSSIKLERGTQDRYSKTHKTATWAGKQAGPRVSDGSLLRNFGLVLGAFLDEWMLVMELCWRLGEDVSADIPEHVEPREDG